MDEATKIRRRFLARIIRKFTVIKELRRQIPKRFFDNMKVPQLFKTLARMDQNKKYAPLIPPKKKQLRIVVEETKVGCEHCLARKAMIYSQTFRKNLCLSCEEQLTIDAGAMVFDKYQKKIKR